MDAPSIYAQVLGPAFSNLAPPLKRLHGSEQRRFTGVLTVRTGSHPLARLSLWLAHLPSAQVNAPCHLCLLPSQRGERWQREIGPWKFITYQRLAFSKRNLRRSEGVNEAEPSRSDRPKSHAGRGFNGELRERFGTVTLGLHLRVKGQSLCVHSVRTWILGIPLPAWLGIRVIAHEKPMANNSFYCNVRVYLPGLGTLLRYSGTLSDSTFTDTVDRLL